MGRERQVEGKKYPGRKQNKETRRRFRNETLNTDIWVREDVGCIPGSYLSCIFTRSTARKDYIYLFHV